MAYTTTASIIYEKNRREGSYPIYLYAIEIEPGAILYYTSNNADVSFYIPGTSTAQTYTAAPITHDQVETNTKGEIGGVQLTVQNVNRYIISLLLTNDALRGCKVSILLVFSDSLTDPDNYLIDEYYIDSSTVTENAAVFNLKSKFVVNQVVLPSRKYKRDQCSWSFKGIECAFKDGYKLENNAVSVRTATSLSVTISKDAIATSLYPVNATLKITHWTSNLKSATTTASNICAGSSYTATTTLVVRLTDAIATSNFLHLYYPSSSVTATSICKKTFNYCATLKNQYRFGGTPTIPTRNIYF